MHTEITEKGNGWVFYDGECPLCTRWEARTHDLLAKRGYHFVPFQVEWARQRLGLDPNAPLLEMKLLTADGRVFGGADALVQLAAAVWWAWPVFALAQLPGAKWMLRRGYIWLAAHRGCPGNRCEIARRTAKRPGAITSAFYELP